MKPDERIINCGMWKWLQRSGLERFEFLQSPGRWIFRGSILTLADSAAEAKYEISCDRQFRTQHVQAAVRDGRGERKLEIASENGRWYQNGSEVEAVRGAVDIDLGWSPSTNTLPIRRLGLSVGQSSGEFTAAWVRFPDLVLEPLSQEYSRLQDRLYQYSSRGGAFKARLQVDEHALVSDYEGIWRRLEP